VGPPPDITSQFDHRVILLGLKHEKPAPEIGFLTNWAFLQLMRMNNVVAFWTAWPFHDFYLTSQLILFHFIRPPPY
jgi:hypothetical protein